MINKPHIYQPYNTTTTQKKYCYKQSDFFSEKTKIVIATNAYAISFYKIEKTISFVIFILVFILILIKLRFIVIAILFMKTTFPIKLFIILLVSFALFNCSKEEIIPTDVEVNNFVWGGMNAYYKWQGEVDDLADTNFSTREQLNNYLAEFDTPDVLFDNLLYTSLDDTSWITDDYTSIEDALNGLKHTTGMKVNGMFAKDSNDFFLYVYDVVAGSNADIQEVKRGMIITEVNGIRLTTGNVEGLFNNDTFSISIADYNEGNPIRDLTDPSFEDLVITLTKQEDFQENPIAIAKVIPTTSYTVGYLLYNNFTAPFDSDLNDVFASFRAANLDHLIVDLRYNGGGCIESANYLASMITGQFEGEVLSNEIWNDKVMANVITQNTTNYFTDEIDDGGTGEAINSLGLTSVYFIVSDATAGPAEMLINGLKQHLNEVVVIGSQTKGITEVSMTLYDSDTYTKNGDNFNNSHTWALQPIVLELQDPSNITHTNGITVDIELLEDSGNLGMLGESVTDISLNTIADPILTSTLEYIETGAITPYEQTTPVSTQNLWNSSSLFLDYNIMYTNL